jgi:hypothetical protein
MTTESLLQSGSDPIECIAIRLSSEGKSLGSGVILSRAENATTYFVLTALHCLENLDLGQGLSIDRFDYTTGKFHQYPIPAEQYKLYHYEPDQSYDLVIIAIPKSLISFAVLSVQLCLYPTPGKIYTFRGFPNVYDTLSPEEFNVKCLMNVGSGAHMQGLDRIENNSSNAQANLGGFSGSALVFGAGEDIQISGIVIEAKTEFNRFTVCSFKQLNDLLSLNGEAKWAIPNPISVDSSNSEVPVTAAYYEFSNRFLDNADRLVEELRPSQAINITQTAFEHINSTNLVQADKNSLLARIYTVNALANADTHGEKDTDNLLIQAHLLAPSILRYQERAVVAYFKKGKIQEAFELAEQILLNDPHNARTWAVTSSLIPELPIPTEVSRQALFVNIKISLDGIKKTDLAISDLGIYFKGDVRMQRMPKGEIPRSELHFWFYLAQYALHEYLHHTVKNHSFTKSEKLKDSSQILYAQSIYRALLMRVDGTELKDNKYFLLCQFDYLHCEYCLYDAYQPVLQMYNLYAGDPLTISLPFKTEINPIFKGTPQRSFDLMISLLQVGEFSKALDIIEIYPEQQHSFLLLIKARVLEKLMRVNESLGYYKMYLTSVKVVNALDAINFIEPITRLIESSEKVENIVEIVSSEKSFELPFSKDLLEAFILKDSLPHRSHVKVLCDSVTHAHLNELPQVYRMLLATIYFTINEFLICEQILVEVTDFEIESPQLRLYIICLHFTGKDSSKMLMLLERWRKRFSADCQLLEIEVDFYHRLHNHGMVEVVAEYAYQNFPEEPIFKIRLLESLNWQEKKEKLKSLLDDTILNLTIPWQSAYMVGNICFLNDKEELGLNIYYNVIKDHSNDPLVRETYFTQLSSFSNLEQRPYPEVAEENMVVKLESKSKVIILELTRENITRNPVAKLAMGKRIDEEFEIFDNLTNLSRTYIVKQVLDKYRGQLALIVDHLVKNPESAINIRSLNVAENDPADMLKEIQTLFGANGTRNEIISKSFLEKFNKTEIGFTELYTNVFNFNPIAAWSHVTSRQGDGFPVLPLILQQNFKTQSDTEFVLDFSSLLTIFHLSKKIDLRFGGKPFIISQLTKDYLYSKLVENQIQRKSRSSISVTERSVSPVFYTEAQIDQHSQYHHELMLWVKENCKTDFAPEGLEKDEKSSTTEENIHKRCAVDTMHLSARKDRILITDDWMYFRNELPFSRITLESYLSELFKPQFTDTLLFELVGLNYRGLTLTGDQLYTSFEKNKMLNRSGSDFLLSLHSFSMEYNPNPQNLLSILSFVKKLYSDTLSLEYKRKISRLVLQHILKHFKITSKLIVLLEFYVNIQFSLLGEHRDHILEDISISANVIKSLNKHDSLA